MAQTSDGAIKVAAQRIGLTVGDYRAKLDAGLKWCTACKDWHPRDQFGIDNSRSDGLKARCFTATRVKERKSIKGRISTFKGRTHTAEAKRRMSEAKKGLKLRLGKKHTAETRHKISKRLRITAARGPANPNYKDGKVAERRDQRFSAEYKRWRYDVFTRDRFTCQQCGDNRGGNLVAHHIKPFADFPELRFDMSNGLTLCESCHNKVHSQQYTTK